jgi:hypothetical protein
MAAIALLDIEAQTMQAQIDAIVPGDDKTHAINQLLLLANLATSKAFGIGLPVKSFDEDWFKVALSAREKIYRLNQKNSTDTTYHDLMQLKLNLLLNLNKKDYPPYATSQEFVDWFWDTLPIDYEELGHILTQLKEKGLKSLTLKQVIDLRTIKYKLGLLSQLQSINPQISDSELSKWLEIRLLLP